MVQFLICHLKVEDGEITDDADADADAASDVKKKDSNAEGARATEESDRKPSSLSRSGWSREDGSQRAIKKVNFEAFLYTQMLVEYLY